MHSRDDSFDTDPKSKLALLIKPVQFSSVGVTNAIRVKSKICLIRLNCLEVYNITVKGLVFSSMYTFSDTLIDLVEYNANYLSDQRIDYNDNEDTDDLTDRYLIILTKGLSLCIFDLEKMAHVEAIQISSRFPVISKTYLKICQNLLFVFVNVHTFMLMKLNVKLGKKKSLISLKNTLTIDYLDIDQLDIIPCNDNTKNILITIKSEDNNLWFYSLSTITFKIVTKHCFPFKESFYFIALSDLNTATESKKFLLLLFKGKQAYFPLPNQENNHIVLHDCVFELEEIKDKINKDTKEMITIKTPIVYPTSHLILKNSAFNNSGVDKCEILLCNENGDLHFIGIESVLDTLNNTNSAEIKSFKNITIGNKKNTSFWNLNRSNSNQGKTLNNSNKFSPNIIIKAQTFFEFQKQNCLIQTDQKIIQLPNLHFLNFSASKKNSCIFKVVQPKAIELVQYLNQFGHGSTLDAEILQEPLCQNTSHYGFLSSSSVSQIYHGVHNGLSYINGNLFESDFKQEFELLNLLNICKIKLDLNKYLGQLAFSTSNWPIILLAYNDTSLKLFQFDDSYALTNSYSYELSSTIVKVFKPPASCESFFILFDDSRLQKMSFSLNIESSIILPNNFGQIIQKNASLYFLTKELNSIIKINLKSFVISNIIKMNFSINYFDLLIKDEYVEYIIFYMEDNSREIINLSNSKSNNDNILVTKQSNFIVLSKKTKNTNRSEFRNVNNSVATYMGNTPYYIETTMDNNLNVINLKNLQETKVLMSSIYDILPIDDIDNLFLLNGKHQKMVRFHVENQHEISYRILGLEFDLLASKKSGIENSRILQISEKVCVCYNSVVKNLQVYRFIKPNECKVIIVNNSIQNEDSKPSLTSSKVEAIPNSVIAENDDSDDNIVIKKRRGNRYISFDEEKNRSGFITNDNITLSNYTRYEIMNGYIGFDSVVKVLPFKGYVRCYLSFEQFIIVATNEFSSIFTGNKDTSKLYVINRDFEILETLTLEDEIVTCMIKGEHKKPDIPFFEDTTSISLQNLLKRTVILASLIKVKDATTTGEGEDIINITNQCKISLLSISETFKIIFESDIIFSEMNRISSLLNYGFRTIFITGEDVIRSIRINYLPSEKRFAFVIIDFPDVNLNTIIKIEAIKNTLIVNDFEKGLFIFKIRNIISVKKEIPMYTVSDYTYKNSYLDYQDSLEIEYEFGILFEGNFVDFNILNSEYIQALDCNDCYMLIRIKKENVILEQFARFDNDYLNFLRKFEDFEDFDRLEKLTRLGIMGSLRSMIYEIDLIHDAKLFRSLIDIQEKLKSRNLQVSRDEAEPNEENDATMEYINGIHFYNHLRKLSLGHCDNFLSDEEMVLLKRIFY